MYGGVIWSGVALLKPGLDGWRRHPVGRRLIVGSGPGQVDLTLARQGVAARHCRVRAVEGGLLVSQLDRSATTLIGGKPLGLKPMPLASGQVLRVAGLPLVAARAGTARGRPWLQIQDMGSGCPKVWHAMADLALAATSDWPVLITGETGTGKELAAHLVHNCSGRARRPLVALNCAAFNAGTLQSELFGATRGAYTSSVQERSGAFERAHGGTLLLDEIGELSAEAQASLLRVLESGEIQVVGGPVRRVDVRLVAATHRDLGREVTAGRFRADLLHRLTVTQVELPPLRRRGRDSAALLERFLSDRPLPAGADSLLDGRRWLGNVRELRNVARRLELRVGEGAVLLEDLANCFAPESAVGEAMPLTVAMGKAERVARLLVSEPSVSAAWRRSGLSRTTFYRYVRLARRTSEEVQIQPEPPVIAA